MNVFLLVMSLGNPIFYTHFNTEADCQKKIFDYTVFNTSKNKNMRTAKCVAENSPELLLVPNVPLSLTILPVLSF